MTASRVFIPRDKPRLWVVFVLACLIGMGVGLLAFGAAWLELSWLALPLFAVFATCWTVAAVSWLGFAFGMLTGRYRNLSSRPWKHQVW